MKYGRGFVLIAICLAAGSTSWFFHSGEPYAAGMAVGYGLLSILWISDEIIARIR